MSQSMQAEIAPGFLEGTPSEDWPSGELYAESVLRCGALSAQASGTDAFACQTVIVADAVRFLLTAR